MNHHPEHDTRFVTHIFTAPIPTKEGYWERLQYFMKKNLSDEKYSLGSGHQTYTQLQIDEYLNNKQIIALEKPVELSPETELYLGIDGNVHRGPFEAPTSGMEVIKTK
jgi:hypothetical protein